MENHANTETQWRGMCDHSGLDLITRHEPPVNYSIIQILNISHSHSRKDPITFNKNPISIYLGEKLFL